MPVFANDVARWRKKIGTLLDLAHESLREINSRWPSNHSAEISALSDLYLTFAYLGRWSAQLDEIAFQLSE